MNFADLLVVAYAVAFSLAWANLTAIRIDAWLDGNSELIGRLTR